MKLIPMLLCAAAFSAPAFADNHCGDSGRARNALRSIQQFEGEARGFAQIMDEGLQGVSNENLSLFQLRTERLLRDTRALEGVLRADRVCTRDIHRAISQLGQAQSQLQTAVAGTSDSPVFEVVFRAGQISGSYDQMRLDLRLLAQTLQDND
jgi:hypothetical protein